MTGYDDAAGDQPGGVSDGRSTAHVGSNPTCSVFGCFDSATVHLSSGATRRVGSVRRGVPKLLRVPFRAEVYCDVHAADVCRPLLRRVMLRELVDNVPDSERRMVTIGRDSLDGCEVGQARLLRYNGNYPHRDRITLPTEWRTRQTFRQGDVECDRCGATWVGVEHSLCPWCLKREGVYDDNPERIGDVIRRLPGVARRLAPPEHRLDVAK